MKPFLIFHEHPDWFRPLISLLKKQEVPFQVANPTKHHYAIEEARPPYSLVFNRMSPSAYLREGVQGIFYTLNYLKHLEASGIRVINGSQAYTYEISKALQLNLLHSLNLPYPKSRVVNHPSQVLAATEGLRFPIVFKANVGGSGAGIVKFDSIADVERAIEEGALDFGIDHTALLQEFIPARGGYITRVETLGGKFLYAIRVYITGETFNLCPADICQTNKGQTLLRNACAVDAPKNGLTVEAYTPDDEVIEAIERIVQESKIDVGGIEYIIDDRDGKLLYYDINALSNFVADAVNVIGFNPNDTLLGFLLKEAGQDQVVQEASLG